MPTFHAVKLIVRCQESK